MFDVFPELLLHAPSETSPENDCINLVVVQEASIVEIAGSDGRPYSVYYCRFRMKQRVRAFIDSYLLFQQRAVPGPRSMPDERGIGNPR